MSKKYLPLRIIGLIQLRIGIIGFISFEGGIETSGLISGDKVNFYKAMSM